MHIQVRLFARARELAGTDVLSVELPHGATVGELKRQLSEKQPALLSLLARCAIAIDDEFASDAQVVPEGAEVALLPPVSGG